MYTENPEGTQVTLGSINMGYDIYPTLPGLELTTCSIPSACRGVARVFGTRGAVFRLAPPKKN